MPAKKDDDTKWTTLQADLGNNQLSTLYVNENTNTLAKRINESSSSSPYFIEVHDGALGALWVNADQIVTMKAGKQQMSAP